MKKLFAAFALISVLALTACSDYTGDAVVDGKSFSPGYTTVNLIQMDKSLIPVTNTVPDSWYLSLHDPAGKTFSVYISKDDYDWVESGRTVHLEHGAIAR
jgi:hypothetical protein